MRVLDQAKTVILELSWDSQSVDLVRNEIFRRMKLEIFHETHLMYL